MQSLHGYKIHAGREGSGSGDQAISTTVPCRVQGLQPLELRALTLPSGFHADGTIQKEFWIESFRKMHLGQCVNARGEGQVQGHSNSDGHRSWRPISGDILATGLALGTA